MVASFPTYKRTRMRKQTKWTAQNQYQTFEINPHTNADTIVGVDIFEEVNDFKYLGSFISADCSIGMAKHAFNRPTNICILTILHTKTKLKMYKSHVRSVLLYTSETRRTSKNIESRFRGFERRILKICWEQRVTNVEIANRTDIVSQEKQSMWRWLRHVLRLSKRRFPEVALMWTPPGKRKRDRPLGTWRRYVEDPRREALTGKTWHELS